MNPPKELTDIYEFGDWLKRYYVGSERKPIRIEPVNGGLIRVTEEISVKE